MPDKDYAVVVGINKYPRHDEYDDLKGAKRDADGFLTWLTSAEGGKIRAKSRIKKHCSNKKVRGSSSWRWWWKYFQR